MDGMREWLADKALMIGALAVVVSGVAFSLAPVWV
jgi:hypothetical protein